MEEGSSGKRRGIGGGGGEEKKKKRGSGGVGEYRFIYFNNINLALKITFGNDDAEGDGGKLLKKGSSNNKSHQRKGRSSSGRLGLDWPLSPSELCDSAATELDHAILR
jgi:hypothetical protein